MEEEIEYIKSEIKSVENGIKYANRRLIILKEILRTLQRVK